MPESNYLCFNCGQLTEPGPISCSNCGLFQTSSRHRDNLPDLFKERQVSVERLKKSGAAIEETNYLGLGGGIGSFVWADYLRVCGAETRQIVVIGYEAVPYARFRRLCRTSQITDSERLRSDSSARPDNLWGWPGYALYEIVELMWRHHWRAAGRLAWQIFGEPTLSHTYTPPAWLVYRAMEREMRRIGWQRMIRRGEICGVRQTDDGRYIAAYLPLPVSNGRPTNTRLHFVAAPYLHLALGYPGICLTPEARAYRQRYGDRQRVVQAYENHEHIYAALGRRGGVVVLQGRGIVASRILHHIDEIRRGTGRPIQVIHLLRSPIKEETVYGQAGRRLYFHRQVQPFNWPKAAFGGDLRVVMAEASPEERQRLEPIWAGPTTSDRPEWLAVVERGLAEGWYRLAFGTVTEIKPNDRKRLIIKTKGCEAPYNNGRLVADFIFDCTGLNTEANGNPIWADLANHYGLEQNGGGGWQVSADFEVKRLRNGGGQVFAAGILTSGNAFAPVDSFLGLQYAAERSIETMIREGAPGIRSLKGAESVRQWWRWVNGEPPY